MDKNVRKIVISVIISFVIISCSSAPKKSAPALSYDGEVLQRSGYESGETSQRSSGENDDRMIAYTISLELAVKNTEDTREMLIEQVKTNNGFIVRETDNFITTRIPLENVENFINTAKTLGITENETKTGTDITDQYRDNVIRLENLKTVRERYLALLEKANTVSDILSIEKELERVNTQIEIMEGRIKYAESSVAYSNITVRYKEKAKPGPVGWIFYGLYRGVKWLFVWN